MIGLLILLAVASLTIFLVKYLTKRLRSVVQEHLNELLRQQKIHTDRALKKIMVSQTKVINLNRTNYARLNELSRQLKLTDSRLYSQIEAYLRLQTILSSEAMAAMGPLRGWAVSPDALLIMVNHVLSKKPKTVVEFGSGSSTIAIGSLVNDYGGKVISFDHDQNYSNETKTALRKVNLDKCVDVRYRPLGNTKIGKKSHIWYSLKDSDIPKSIHMVFVDGPPESTQKLARLPAMNAIYPQLISGASVFVDDFDREDDSLMVDEWLGRYPDLSLLKKYTEKGMAVITKN